MVAVWEQNDRMLDPTTTLHRLGGIARGTHLQRHGISRKALAVAAASGRILRVRAGVFAAPQTRPDVVAAAAHGGALTCSSALRQHGVWVLADASRPHVWMGRNGRTHPHLGCRCVGHFYAGATRLGIVDVEQALVHLFRCAGDEAFFASLESALQQRLLNVAGRQRIRDRLPENARWLVDLARSDADSGLESLLRLRLHVLGIRLDCQVVITGVGRVDFVVGGRLIIEVDGRENHASPAHRHKDLVRDAATSAMGYESLRFDYAQIVHDWPTVQAAIVAALVRLGAVA